MLKNNTNEKQPARTVGQKFMIKKYTWDGTNPTCYVQGCLKIRNHPVHSGYKANEDYGLAEAGKDVYDCMTLVYEVDEIKHGMGDVLQEWVYIEDARGTEMWNIAKISISPHGE